MDENRRKMPFNKTIQFLTKLAVFATPIGLFIVFFMPRAGGQAVWVAIYALVLGLLSISFGCYQVGVYRLRTLVWSFCAALFFTNAVAVLQIWLIFNRLMLTRMTLLLLAQCAATMVMYILANAVYFAISPPRRMLAVCRGTRGEIKMIRRFAENRDRFILTEILSSSMGETVIKQAIDNVPAVLLGEIDKQLRDSLTSYCFENNKRLFVVPNMEDVMMHEAHLTQIGDSMVFMCKNRGMTYEQAVVKRALDLVASAVGMVLLSPILILTAILVKTTSAGPVFYKQTRVTKDGREFTLYKFRSMVKDAEKDGKPVLSCSNDARVTPVGRIIRRLRIDELPQLYNILIGDMSLVGPRPERPEIMAQFIANMPSFSYRLKVKAGLTGYAQVFGRYNTPFEDKVKMDVYYIAHYSLTLDLQLILSTVRILFMKDSTQGVDENEPPVPIAFPGAGRIDIVHRQQALRRGQSSLRTRAGVRAKASREPYVYSISEKRPTSIRRHQRAVIQEARHLYSNGDVPHQV
jgi:exopolysaccharide biosynthesis polyprenyl glycosylphosphotransferase